MRDGDRVVSIIKWAEADYEVIATLRNGALVHTRTIEEVEFAIKRQAAATGNQGASVRIGARVKKYGGGGSGVAVALCLGIYLYITSVARCIVDG